MKKKLGYLIVAMLIVVCGFGGYVVKVFNKPKDTGQSNQATVKMGDVTVKVVETGTIDASKTVEVKSRVQGRLKKLLVEEGDVVKAGQLVALIDPQEAEIVVNQQRAQLRGAMATVERQSISITQRKQSAKAAYDQAVAHMLELKATAATQPKLTQASIDQSRMALSSATHERDRLAQTAQPTALATAKASVDEAQANLNAADAEYKRQTELLAKGYTSKRDVEAAGQTMLVAQARLDTAKDTLSHLKPQQDLELRKANDAVKQAQADLDRANANRVQDSVADRQYEQAVASVATAKAALMDAAVLQQQRVESQASADQMRFSLEDGERQLGYTEVRAPIAGVVTKKLIQEGELVTSLGSFSSGTSIMRIEDRSQMQVNLDVNEIDAARMKTGMAADVTVDAIPGVTLKGVVKSVSPASDAVATSTSTTVISSDAVVKYQVKVTLDTPEKRLRSGMSAKVSMIVASRKGVLMLPLEFVTVSGADATITWPAKPNAKPDAKPETKSVKIGIQNGTDVEIVSGLKEGDVVARPAFNGPERKGMMQAGPD